jgi:hypothetical protein
VTQLRPAYPEELLSSPSCQVDHPYKYLPLHKQIKKKFKHKMPSYSMYNMLDVQCSKVKEGGMWRFYLQII